MRESGEAPDLFFHRHRFGSLADGALPDALSGYQRMGEPPTDDESPPSLVIDEVERIWAAIAESDDWQPLMNTVAAIRRLGDRLGPAPEPAGHTRSSPSPTI